MSGFFYWLTKGQASLNVDSTQYPCFVCDQGFSTAGSLDEHYKTHSLQPLPVHFSQPQNEQLLTSVATIPELAGYDGDLLMSEQPLNTTIRPTTTSDIDAFHDRSSSLSFTSSAVPSCEDAPTITPESVSEEYSSEVYGLNTGFSTISANSDASFRPWDIVSASLSSSNSNSPLARHNYQGCICVLCLKRECTSRYLSRASVPFTCLVPKCSTTPFFSASKQHKGPWHRRNFYKHYERGPEKFVCNAPNCGYISKRYGDLQRHSRTHCIETPQYPCNEFGCSRGGDNGFHRKDKLQDHQRKVHQGNLAPRRLGQPLRPIVAKTRD